MRQNEAVFLDLNGTLVLPVLVDRLSELRPIAGVGRAVARLCQEGFLCPVVTVQSRIEKGLFTEEAFRNWFGEFARDLAREGARVSGPYLCPHRFATPCQCAKPRTLLYERAAEELGIDLARSFTIGDTSADVEAGVGFGGRGCLVLTGYSRGETTESGTASFAGGALAEVVDWILEQEGPGRSEIRIRPAELTDAPAISILISDLAERHFAWEFSEDGRKLMLESMGPRPIRICLELGFEYHVAECGEELVGAVATRDDSHLYHLFVSDRFQGQGLARRLWELAMRRCVERSGTRRFTVNASNNAVGVYESLGFVRQGPMTSEQGILSNPMVLTLGPPER